MSVWTTENIQTSYSKLQEGSVRGEVSSPLEGRKSFVEHLLKQSKQLSQLIARSWLEDEKAKEIRNIFLKPGEPDEPDKYLKELFAGKRNGKDGQPLCEEIFDERELEVYRFKIDVSSFVGSLTEETNLSAFTLILPYPPRPVLGEFTIEYSTLKAWANTPIEYDTRGVIKDPFPPHPYIPYSTT